MQAAALSFVVGWIFFSAEFYNPFDTIQVSSHCLQTQKLSFVCCATLFEAIRRFDFTD